VKVDARVMASTNVQLDEAVAAGRFREGPLLPPQRHPPGDPAAEGAARGHPAALRPFRPALRRALQDRASSAPARADPGVPAPRLAGQRARARELRAALRDPGRSRDVARRAPPHGRGCSAVVASRTEARPEAGPDPDEGLSLRRVSARAAEEAERRSSAACWRRRAGTGARRPASSRSRTRPC
jgi:hypothetical protein